MPRGNRHAKPVAGRTPEEMLHEALSSKDGLLIGDLVKRIELAEASPEFVQRALKEIASAHPEMGPIVIGCLSTLARMNSSELRPLCRVIINAPFNPDRDLVVAHAACLLASHPDPEKVDALLLGKAVDHRSEHIKLSARRAVSALSKLQADALLARVAELPNRPELLVLKRFASPEAQLSQLVLPPAASYARPVKAPLEQAKVAPLPQKGGRSKANQPVLAPPKPAPEAPEPLAPPPSVASPRKEPDQVQLGAPQPIETTPDLLELLNPHRIRGYHLLSDSALANTVILSKNYRDVAAALAEITVRRGADHALMFNERLVYALSDDENPEHGRFCDIAKAWFRFS